MAFDMRTHNVKVRGGKQVLTRVNPHIRLKRGDDPPIFIQGGRFYAENGEEWDPVPDWALEQVANLSETARREAGLDDPTDQEMDQAKLALAESNKDRGWGQPPRDAGLDVTAGAEAALDDEGGKAPVDTEAKLHGADRHAKAAKQKPKPKVPARDDSSAAQNSLSQARTTTSQSRNTTAASRKTDEAETLADIERALADDPDDPEADRT